MISTLSCGNETHTSQSARCVGPGEVAVNRVGGRLESAELRAAVRRKGVCPTLQSAVPGTPQNLTLIRETPRTFVSGYWQGLRAASIPPTDLHATQPRADAPAASSNRSSSSQEVAMSGMTNEPGPGSVAAILVVRALQRR